MMESTKSKRVWHSGPPPHVGWWNASSSAWMDAWRWWDGMLWSHTATPHCDAALAEKNAAFKSIDQDRIRWSDYYPANARVPRVDPRMLAPEAVAPEWKRKFLEVVERILDDLERRGAAGAFVYAHKLSSATPNPTGEHHLRIDATVVPSIKIVPVGRT